MKRYVSVLHVERNVFRKNVSNFLGKVVFVEAFGNIYLIDGGNERKLCVDGICCRFSTI